MKKAVLVIIIGLVLIFGYFAFTLLSERPTEVVDQNDIDISILNEIPQENKNNSNVSNNAFDRLSMLSNGNNNGTTTQQPLPTQNTTPPTTGGTNTTPTQPTATALKSGSFNQLDAAHGADGQAVIRQTSQGPVLSFENFNAKPGPDLFVYLSKDQGLNSTRSGPGEFVSLGVLKSTQGPQVYALPENYDEFNSVLIWCRAFSILFSAADLQ